MGAVGVLFTLGGFVGNFIFSVADHAANGFFFTVEWAPVVASAAAIGFLSVLLLLPGSYLMLRISVTVLLLDAGVGVWGFILHTMGNLRGPSIRAFDNFIYGAPAMAPLLFPNLVLLGLIGLWRLKQALAYPAGRLESAHGSQS